MAKRPKKKPASKPKAKPAGKPKPEFVRGSKLSESDEPQLSAESFVEVSDPRKRLYLRALAYSPRFGYAARAAGVCPATSYNWRADKSDVTFQAAVERAIKMGVERMESELIRRGIEGIEKPVYQSGHLVGTVREYDTTAAIFMLKGIHPEKYRETHRHEHGGVGGGPIAVEHSLADLSDAEVERRYLNAQRYLEAAKDSEPVIDVTAEPIELTAEERYEQELKRREEKR